MYHGFGAAGPNPRERMYYDISHFRAPYKNAVFNGLGQESDPRAALVDVVDGVPTFKPAVAQALMNVLGASKVVAMAPSGGGGASELSGFEMMAVGEYGQVDGATWAKQRAASGKVVIAAYALVVPVEGSDRIVAAFDDTPSNMDKAKSLGFDDAAVLLRGEKAGALHAGMGPVGWTLLVVGGLGLVWMFSKGGQRAVANAGMKRVSPSVRVIHDRGGWYIVRLKKGNRQHSTMVYGKKKAKALAELHRHPKPLW
jgi:hypothetical protein